MDENDLLEDYHSDPVPAEKGIRFANFIIDLVVAYALVFLSGMGFAYFTPDLIFDASGEPGLIVNFIGIFVFLLYFALLEGGTGGRTVGKFITGTIAVKEDGSPVNFADAFKRSLSRLVPFEAFSGLSDRPWHDKWTNTMVIKKQ